MDRKASCSIVLTPTGKSFYLPGEIISGDINLTVNAPINIKNMKVEIAGQVKCTICGDPTQYTAAIIRPETASLFSQNPSSLVPLTNGISSNEVSHLHLSKICYMSKTNLL